MISFFNAVNTYTDASVSQDKFGAQVTCAGFVTTFHGEIIDRGLKIVRNGTNNYGEILAIYMGIINLLKYKNYDAFLNLFSDSYISVSGLKEWIYSWLRDKDEFNRLRTGEGKEVANQEIFSNIINYIVENQTHLSIFHQRGHKNPDKLEDMNEVKTKFEKINGTEISEDIVREICYYNNMVDNMTRAHLIDTLKHSNYKPTTFDKPLIVASRVLDWNTMNKYKNLIS